MPALIGGRGVREVLCRSHSLADLVLALHGWLVTSSSVFSRVYRQSGPSASRIRTPGVSDLVLFPLPLVEKSSTRSSRSRVRERRRRPEDLLTDLLIVCLNLMHCGPGPWKCLIPPSAAQARLQDSLAYRASRFFRAVGSHISGGETAIRSLLRQPRGEYGEPQVARPLSAKAGVPEFAATCDTVRVLENDFPELSRWAASPDKAVLSDEMMPKELPKPFCWVTKDYPEVIRKGVASGLMELKPAADLYHVHGRPLHSGVFEVPKADSATEARMIFAGNPVNAVLDPAKCPSPIFPYLRYLHQIFLQPGKRLRVWKRDARHYYHCLSAPAAWRALLAYPPCDIEGFDEPQYPCSTAWPMGFGGSATVAQAVALVAARRAGLPMSKRIAKDLPVPRAFPVWASILDDVWAIEIEPDDDHEASEAKEWVQRLEAVWADMGIVNHEKKVVDGARRAEVQGAEVGYPDPTIGVAPVKRFELMSAMCFVLTSFRPGRYSLERLLGKFMHCTNFSPLLRSAVGVSFRDLLTARDAKENRVYWDATLWEEYVLMGVLLPLAETDLSLPISTLVTASDAAPGGHGLSFTRMSEQDVRESYRSAEFCGSYTSLCQDPDVAPTSQMKSSFPLEPVAEKKPANLPIVGASWQHVSRPGGYRHITLEECTAVRWGLEDRIRRPSEIECRAVALCDNTVTVFAIAKGRSSSRLLNAEVRKIAALCLASNLWPAVVWISTLVNPADEPSRRYALNDKFGKRYRLPPVRAPAQADGTSGSADIILFLGSDFEWDCIRDTLLDYFPVGRGWVVAHVPLDGPAGLGEEQVFQLWMSRARAGRVAAVVAAPHIRTWSRLRLRQPGPKLLRSKRHPWGTPESSELPDFVKVEADNAIVRKSLDIMSVVSKTGGTYVMEHPSQLRRTVPSLWGDPFGSTLDSGS